MKIDITIRGSKPQTETFESTDEVREYMDKVDNLLSNLSDFVPSVTVAATEPTPEPDFDAVGSSPSVEAESKPTRRKKEKSRRVTKEMAKAVYDELSRHGTRKVKSSTYRVKLMERYQCSDSAAQTWVTKLNKLLPPKGKIRLDHQRI